MIVLGLTRDVHDPAAAILVDGRLQAAAEEERFTRVKHASGSRPVEAARFCLAEAGCGPEDVDLVAYPWSLEAYRAHRWTFARNHLHLPRTAWRALSRTQARWRKEVKSLHQTLRDLGLDPAETPVAFVPHHLSHQASAFHFSGMDQAALLSVDAMGEFDSSLLAHGSVMGIRPVGRTILPRSLGTVYTAFTEYLGLGANDGEYKLMGMAPYGDPGRTDLSPIFSGSDGDFFVSARDVFPPSSRRGQGRYYSRRFEELFGPPRCGSGLSEPYIHIAAAVQAKTEEILCSLVQNELAEPLAQAQGRLCLSGGVALNVKANGRLLSLPEVREIFVQPAAHDAGGAVGAAAHAAAVRGECIEPMDSAYLGPSYGEDVIRRTLESRRIPFSLPENPAETVADLIAAGHAVARFAGAMEWGPRALGNRSILAHPGQKGTADRVNGLIKFREPWRPFCPILSADRAPEILGTTHPCPWMTLSFPVLPAWRDRLTEVVHVDGTTRPQILSRDDNPGLFQILQAFEARTGLPALLNTSFNRRGEPIVCTPDDALRTFYGSGLRYMILGPYLMSKGE